jgi:hypothetical protein
MRPARVFSTVASRPLSGIWIGSASGSCAYENAALWVVHGELEPGRSVCREAGGKPLRSRHPERLVHEICDHGPVDPSMEAHADPALLQSSKRPGWDSPRHMTNIFPRTRKVGSPRAIFSVASGSARQILRNCFSGPRPLGMHRPMTDLLQTVTRFRPSVHHGRLSNAPSNRAREPRIRLRATVPYFTVSAHRSGSVARSEVPQNRRTASFLQGCSRIDMEVLIGRSIA